MNRKINRIVGVLALTLWILSFSVVIVINSHFLYRMYIQSTNLMDDVGKTIEQVMFIYKELMRYLGPFSTGPLAIEGVKMSQEGIIHFKEVRDIFILFYQILLVSSLILGYLIIRFKKETLTLIKPASKVMILIPTILGLMMAIDFNRVFVLFHQIAFRNDLWIFDPAYDPIILLLPESFFMLMGLAIVILILIIVGILWGVKYYLSR